MVPGSRRGALVLWQIFSSDAWIPQAAVVSMAGLVVEARQARREDLQRKRYQAKNNEQQD